MQKWMSSPSIWGRKEWFENIDILIIGGGITGLSTALHLKSKAPNRKITVIEGQALGNLASTRNAGFACFGSVGELMVDLDQMNESQVKKLLQYRFQGLQLLKTTLGEAAIDYKPIGGFEVFKSNFGQFENHASKLDYFNKLIFEALELKETFSIKAVGLSTGFLHNKGIYNQYEGALNPVKMMKALNKKVIDLGVEIVRGIKVDNIDKENKTAQLSNGETVDFKTIALCTNSLASDLLPELDVQIGPNIVAYAAWKSASLWQSTYHLDQGYLYFRRVDSNRILLGGGRNQLIGKKLTNEEEDIFIKKYLNEIMFQLTDGEVQEVDGFWKGYLGVGKDRFPIVQKVSDQVYCGVRLGGMGVAIGSYLGKNLADLILNT